MPRVLNVEQLETRFSSLTRARDSITGLSSWIMRHSEFCEEIVEEWLAGLSKDFNALVMFYVANDVIMNCGKKRVPQYRTAFAKALEKAVALSNVKAISKEILRVLKIWRERDIYSEEFCENIQNKLIEEVGKIIPDVRSVKEGEECEANIIANYKKEHLFEKLENMKKLIREVMEKEEILKFAEKPEMPALQSLGLQECQNLLNKVNRYYATLKTFVKLSDQEIAARNNALRELKNTQTFYTSQNEDVKKVAHAYRLYGKKIKNVTKMLSAKRETLPAHHKNSPYVSDNDTSSPKSPDDTFSPMDNSSDMGESTPATPDNSSKKGSKLDKYNETDNAPNTSVNRKFNQNSKLFQIWNEKQEDTSVKTPDSTDIKSSDVMHYETGSLSFEKENISTSLNDKSNKPSDSPLKSNFELQENSLKCGSVSPSHKPIIKNSLDETLISTAVVANNSDGKLHVRKSEFKSTVTNKKFRYENIKNQSPVYSENETSQEYKISISTSTVDIIPKSNSNKQDIDQLLEREDVKETKRQKIKRKIEMLLKSKGKKHCPETETKKNIEHCTRNVSDHQQVIVSQSVDGSESFESSRGEICSAEKIDRPVVKVFSENRAENAASVESDKASGKSNLSSSSSVENKSNKESLVEGSGTLSKSMPIDCAEFNTRENRSERKSNIGIEETVVDDASKENSENSTNEILPLGNYLSISTELLKNILSKQKEISDSSSEQKEGVMFSTEKLDDFQNLKTPLHDSFFAAVGSSETFKKSNLIPGLEISEEPKTDVDSFSDKSCGEEDQCDVKSEKDSDNINQSDGKGFLIAVKKEEINSTKQNVLTEEISENVINCLPDKKLIDVNYSTNKDHTCKEVEVKDNSTFENSVEVDCDSICINPTSRDTNSEKLVNNLTFDEKSKTNKPKSLIQTLTHILEHLSNKEGSSNLKNQIQNRTLNVSLENCLRIYGALVNVNTGTKTSSEINSKTVTNTLQYKSSDLLTQNNKIDFCTTTNALHGPISSTFESSNIPSRNQPINTITDSSAPNVNKDNLEVADMECDSE